MFVYIHTRMSSFDISKMTVSLGMHTVGNGADFGNDAQVTRRVAYATIHNGYNDATFVCIFIASFDLTTFVDFLF